MRSVLPLIYSIPIGIYGQVVFTDPAIPRAGEPVDVLYNPDATALRGRPEAWLRAGWNR